MIDILFKKIDRLSFADAFLIKTSLCLTFIIGLFVLIEISGRMSVPIPATGGTLREGMIGTPRFINPVLAVTRVDKDMSALIYDGLMVVGSEGVLEPNVAESITPSDDGMTYNVILRSNIFFHDGTPLTAHDVAFTVEKIHEQMMNSPLRASFDGVRIEIISDTELNFILPDPYTLFMENLTFGILPKHIWQSIPPEQFSMSSRNTHPIGTGPYTITTINETDAGVAESYILTASETYHRGVPRIETLHVRFFSTEDDLIAVLKEGGIDNSASVLPNTARQLSESHQYAVLHTPLPRAFVVFFNQNKSAILRDPTVREALSVSVDRSLLMESELASFAQPLTSPIPTGFAYDDIRSDTAAPTQENTPIERARDILKKGGWNYSTSTNIWEKTIDKVTVPLSFSLSTAQYSPFDATVAFLHNTWTELGATIEVKQFEQSDLTQTVIRPRDYEAFLSGIHIGRGMDFFAYWHSSQRIDPGFNLALYANIDVDKALTTYRTTHDTNERKAAIQTFVTELQSDIPAIFLYSPEFVYVTGISIQGVQLAGINDPSERFAHIHTWYIDTEDIWPLFDTYK